MTTDGEGREEKGKLSAYEQVQCPYCSAKRHLRAYLHEDPHIETHYRTSECPEHGAFWMPPEAVKKIRYPKKEWVFEGDPAFT